jgi:hypothetical protein
MSQERRDLFSAFGCEVHAESILGPVEGWLKGKNSPLVVIDAESYGAEGPKWVQEMKVRCPAAKIAVIGSKGSRWESEYRANQILYYAIEPFVEREVSDMLQAAFRVKEKPVQEKPISPRLPNWISKIEIRNRHSKRVKLLVSGEVLHRSKGTGLQLQELILRNNYPVTATVGAKSYNVMDMMKELENCDRLIVLEAVDHGRIPGTAEISAGSKLLKGFCDHSSEIETISVLVDQEGLTFDSRTNEALAGLILQQMEQN